MQYPKFLQENDTIGITAPSSGVGDNIPACFYENLSYQDVLKNYFPISL